MTQAGPWRRLGTVLAVGAVYDLSFGVAILGFTRPAARLLGLPVPDDPVHLYLNGVLLLILGGVYLAAARDPERYVVIAPISAGGRALGFLLFVGMYWTGRPRAFFALGCLDLALGVATLAAWRRARVK